MSSNETYYARWLAACCPDHPAICRCCNPCPKNRGLQERSVRRQKFASHSPTDAVEPKPVTYSALVAVRVPAHTHQIPRAIVPPPLVAPACRVSTPVTPAC